MNYEVQKLIDEFHRISSKGWIKSVNRSFGSVGLTFEQELGKTPDSMYFPDYYGTELKCSTRYSRYPLFLFTVVFDGPTFPEINRIVELYGRYDKDFKNKKVLFARANCYRKTIVHDKYKFKFEIDKKEEKLYLCVYDLENHLIEKKSFVYLLSIFNHLMLKLNRLALIYASKKDINGTKYFRYYKICIYELIGFDKFLELLEDGYIEIDIISRISKGGVDNGRYRNRNLVFSIKKYYIDKLFRKIYSFDGDFESS